MGARSLDDARGWPGSGGGVGPRWAGGQVGVGAVGCVAAVSGGGGRVSPGAGFGSAAATSHHKSSKLRYILNTAA